MPSDTQLIPTQVFTAHETVDEFNRKSALIGVYGTREWADAAAKGRGWYGGMGAVEAMWALPVPGKRGEFYLLQSDKTYTLNVDLVDRDRAEKAAALAKLTPAERTLLGLEE